MAADNSNPSLGRCPRCDAEITPAYLVIEYETDGGRSAYAECPGCEEIVTPE